MNSKRRTIIASRLCLFGGLTLVCLATLAAVAIMYAFSAHGAVDAPRQGALIRALEANQIEWLLERHRRVIEDAPSEVDPAQLARHSRTADEAMQRIEQLVRRADSQLSAEVSRALPGLWQQGDEVLRLTGQLDRERAVEAAEQYAASAELLRARIWAHRREWTVAASHTAGFLGSGSGGPLKVVAGVTFVVALLFGTLAAVELKNTLLRLNRVTDAMLRLARNDTDVGVEGLTGGDKIGEVARAVTVFKDNAVRLRQVNNWLEVALNSMARGLSMFDRERRLLVCNSACRRMYLLPDELMRPGTPFDRIVEHRQALIAAVDGEEDKGASGLSLALNRLLGQGADGKLRQRFVDGRIVEVSVKPMPGGGWVALHEDVTERLAAAEKVERLARQDTLTGLANRHAFQEGLDKATAELAGGEGFALLVIDLDRFKDVNDAFGHPGGDALLAAVGRRLGELARREDLVARLGGDEFAIIQRSVSDRSFASALAQRVIEALHVPFHIQGQRVEISGTVGIALAPDDGRSASDLMKNADLALYRGKLERRGTTRFFDPAMERRMRARRALEADLAHAVARAELELHYQPIVSLEAKRVTGCEALIRWRHPERGVVPPVDFIPLAEETGLICGIGAWALGEACQAAARWPRELRVAVNLSVAQFTGPDLAAITANALGASGLSPRRLELEVTESLLLGDDPATLALLHRLRDLGVGIALDDFGTGYSSLSHLRSFPFDKIKIDQTFVRDLPQMKNCEAIVGAVARLASSLDMTTVAEGVESEEHLSRVEAAGCDAVQGYLFSRPVPEERLSTVIAEIDARLAARGGMPGTGV